MALLTENTLEGTESGVKANCVSAKLLKKEENATLLGTPKEEEEDTEQSLQQACYLCPARGGTCDFSEASCGTPHDGL